jgi:hypothetical protein
MEQIKKYKDGNHNTCYSTRKYHFTITKEQTKKPVILESVLGCGRITRKHAVVLLREIRK